MALLCSVFLSTRSVHGQEASGFPCGISETAIIVRNNFDNILPDPLAYYLQYYRINCCQNFRVSTRCRRTVDLYSANITGELQCVQYALVRPSRATKQACTVSSCLLYSCSRDVSSIYCHVFNIYWYSLEGSILNMWELLCPWNGPVPSVHWTYQKEGDELL